jgi:bis(5'-nucleosyl)-tetraphosphatase (symmetrical)
MRWVVGDVHGCALEFGDLLERIRFDPAADELWSVGDLVNTGPDSLGALRLWAETGGRAVIGNHDVYAILARSGRVTRREDRLAGLYASPDCDPLLARLRACQAMTRLDRGSGRSGVWIVHAGVHPLWNDLPGLAARLETYPHDDDWLSSHELAFLTRVRCCDRFGDRARFTGRPEDAPPPFKPWDDFYAGEDVIVHGHWAMRGFYRGERTIGIDSACVYGGRLTAWSPDDDRLESVPCRVPRGYLI